MPRPTSKKPLGLDAVQILRYLMLLPEAWLSGYQGKPLPGHLKTIIRRASRATLQALLVEVACELEQRSSKKSPP